MRALVVCAALAGCSPSVTIYHRTGPRSVAVEKRASPPQPFVLAVRDESGRIAIRIKQSSQMSIRRTVHYNAYAVKYDHSGSVWNEIAEIAADPLATIGAHTVNHVMLRKFSDDAVRSEMANSAAVIEAALGKRPAHFSYPVGDRTSAGPREFAIAAELGFKTAVTTQPGMLFRGHGKTLTALPRISLNGEYQRLRYVRVLLSGSATAMWNGLRGLEAA